MTTGTKPGAPFQGPSWAEVAADPRKLGISSQPGRGKKFAEDQPRDDHGRWIGSGAGSRNEPTNETDRRTFSTLSEDEQARVREVSHQLYDPMAPGGSPYTVAGAWKEALRQVLAERGKKDFSEELHPRDDHGRFTDTGSLGDTAIQQGGFSLSLAGDKPRSGWMVSKFDSERSFSIEQLAAGQDMSFVPGNPWHDNFTHEVDRFVQDKLPDLQKQGAYLGGWVDSGRLFLDVSYNFQDEAEARQFAQDNRQFAMFNAGTGDYVEFEQDRRAAAREAADQKAKTEAKEREKVLLKVGPDDTAESIAEKLHRALFG